MIDVKFEPPRKGETPQDRLLALERWARETSEKLNVAVEAINRALEKAKTEVNKDEL